MALLSLSACSATRFDIAMGCTVRFDGPPAQSMHEPSIENSDAGQGVPESNPRVPPDESALMAPHPIGDGTATFQPGEGLTIQSNDGHFALQVGLRLQLRYELRNHRHRAETGDTSDTGDTGDTGDTTSSLSNSFGIRRARIKFAGHVFNRHNRFKTELGLSPRDLQIQDGVVRRSPLLTWYLEFDYLRDLTVRLGQYKIPFSRQRVISSGDLQLVDRSMANGEFNLDRDIGLDVRSTDVGGLGGYLAYYAGVYMGEGRDVWNTAGTFDFHYLGRLELNPLGGFDSYSESDFARASHPGVSFGVAYSFVDEAQRNRGVLGNIPADGGTTDYHSATADMVLKWMGWSVSSEVFWRSGVRHVGDATRPSPDDPTRVIPVARERPRNGVGWMVQSGYLIPRVALEVAARYSGIRGDSVDTALGQRDSVGGGVSYYFARHAVKVQADYFRQWDDGDLRVGRDQFRLQLELGF